MTLLQLGLDRLQRIYFIRLLDHRDLAHNPVESSLVQLSFRIRLFRLRLRTVEVAHDFSNRVDVAGVDFGLIFLSPAATTWCA